MMANGRVRQLASRFEWAGDDSDGELAEQRRRLRHTSLSPAVRRQSRVITKASPPKPPKFPTVAGEKMAQKPPKPPKPKGLLNKKTAEELVPISAALDWKNGSDLAPVDEEGNGGESAAARLQSNGSGAAASSWFTIRGTELELDGSIYCTVVSVTPEPSCLPKGQISAAEVPPALPVRNAESAPCASTSESRTLSPAPPIPCGQVGPPELPKSPPPRRPPAGVNCSQSILYGGELESEVGPNESGDYDTIEGLLSKRSLFYPLGVASPPAEWIEKQSSWDEGEDSQASWDTTSSITTVSSAGGGLRLVAFRNISDSSSRGVYDIDEHDEVELNNTNDILRPASEGCVPAVPEADQNNNNGDKKADMEKPKGKRLFKKFRPLSQPSIDVDKLLRIKSDIKLNLAKQVGKIKLKVTSANPSPNVDVDDAERRLQQRRSKSKSTFYTTTDELSSSLADVAPAKEPSRRRKASLGILGGARDALVAKFQFPLSSKAAEDSDASEAEEKFTDEEDDELFVDDWSDAEEFADAGSHHEATSLRLPDVVPANQRTLCALPVSSAEPELHEVKRETNGKFAEQEQDEAEELGNVERSGTLCSVSSSRFASEQPLYQYYIIEEDKRRPLPSIAQGTSTADLSSSLVELVEKCGYEGVKLRSLWSELPQVVESGVLSNLSKEERRRQEVMFEVITSEASYLHSLDVLVDFFVNSSLLTGLSAKFVAASVITPQERKNLFSNVVTVRNNSFKLLSVLEKRLEQNCLMDDVCDLLSASFEADFDCYVTYCSNQTYQDRCLAALKTENDGFREVLTYLESEASCQGLGLRSFLMLPMQRVTRYPLLLYALLDATDRDAQPAQYASVRRALTLANQLVKECNEGARRMERMEQLIEVERSLVYRKTKGPQLRRVALSQSGRYLVKRGRLVQLVQPTRTTHQSFELDSQQRRKSSVASFVAATLRHHGHACRLKLLYLLLFNDLLIVTKEKSSEQFLVKNYCQRQFVESHPLECDSAQLSAEALAALTDGGRRRVYLLSCTLMRDAYGRQEELILSAESETDRQRWMNAFTPPTAANPEERIYAEWDCPVVQVAHPYKAQEDDELTLETGDVIDVLHKMPDGWYEGERRSKASNLGGADRRRAIRGWFPSSYVQEVVNDHVRAKNYRQRLRMIQAAESLMHK